MKTRVRFGTTPTGKRYYARHGKDYSLVNVRQAESTAHVRKQVGSKVTKTKVEIKHNRPTLGEL